MSQEVETLAKQKRELLLESEINRQILQIEINQLQTKASEWRQGLLKFSTAYKWVVPLAGAGLGFLTARKQVRNTARKVSAANGSQDGSGSLGYLALLAPLGSALLRRAYKKWRRSQRVAKT
jgi:hypothetical protein